jgi:hypothetical protein
VAVSKELVLAMIGELSDAYCADISEVKIRELQLRDRSVEEVQLQRRQLADDFTDIRLKLEQERSEEKQRMRREKRVLEEEASLERIRLEEEKARELKQLREEQKELEKKLRGVLLPQEEEAMRTGQMVRIKLSPTEEFLGNGPREFHYRLAESQFFRMCGSNKNKYKVWRGYTNSHFLCDLK